MSSPMENPKAKTSVRNRLNLLITLGVVAALGAQLFVLPWLPGRWAIVALLAFALVNVPFWSLIHEAVHRNFVHGRKANEAAGRALSILFGIPFALLRFGHLMHHQYNREWETELYRPPQTFAPAALNHYSKMLGGLYLSEVLAAFAIALAPAPVAQKIARRVFADDRHYEAAERALLKPESVRRVRTDCAAIALLYGAAMVLGGWKIPVAAILLRAFLVSILDNAYHYGTAPDNSQPALELALPRLLSHFVLHFNHHKTHHRNPALPWHALPTAHVQGGEGYDVPLGTAIVAQFRGPILTGGE